MAVGIFDSGLGGLTVLDAVTRRLPEVPFVYYGDNAHAPYGVRDADDIYNLTIAGVERLFAAGCDLVILACNTASAAALRRMQENWVPRDKLSAAQLAEAGPYCAGAYIEPLRPGMNDDTAQQDAPIFLSAKASRYEQEQDKAVLAGDVVLRQGSSIRTETIDAAHKAQGAVKGALRGDSVSHITRDGEGSLFFSVATPIRVGGDVVGAVALTSNSVEIDRLVRYEREQILQVFLIAVVVSIGLSLMLASTISKKLSIWLSMSALLMKVWSRMSECSVSVGTLT